MTAPTGPTPTPADLRDLTTRARDLAAAIRATHTRLAAGDEPTRRTGYRLDDAAGWLDQVADDLDATASDLARVRGRGTCQADWGLCPEHGHTLTSSGGTTWCQRPGCGRSWSYDRGGLPCPEHAAYTLADPDGGDILLCAGHGRVALDLIEGTVTLTPIP